MSALSTLTDAERTERDQLEQVVSAGVMSFIEVGNALLTIADKRLYRETHGSFEPYCREKWGMSARRAYQLCEAAKTVSDVNNCSQSDPELRNNVSQLNARSASELAKVEPEKRAEVLKKAKATGKITAKSIKEISYEDDGLDEEGFIKAPLPMDDKWLNAMGMGDAKDFKPTEPMVTEYYNRLEALVIDALENASEKQLNSMSVYAKAIPGLVRDELKRRKDNK
jgi:hypothetical protein